MTYDQAKKLGAKLAGLFQTVTSEQMKLAIKEFQRFDEAPTEQAINEHRGKHEFVNWPQLYEGCRAAGHAASAEAKTVPIQSFADVIRGQDAQLREVKSDLEVLLRSYRKRWHAGGFRDRDTLKRQCATSLIVGVLIDGKSLDRAAGDDWAETVFGDVKYFQQVLDQIRWQVVTGAVPIEPDSSWRASLDGIRSHFEGAYQSVRAAGSDEYGLAMARVYLIAFAKSALLQLTLDGNRMSGPDADEMARAFVGLNPGQKVPLPPRAWHIQTASHSSWDSLQALARHEHGQKALPGADMAGSISD